MTYTADIELEIIFDSHCGESCPSIDVVDDVCDGAVYLAVEVSGTVSRYYPARVSGPPDSWCPEEGGEVEVTGLACKYEGDSLDYDAIAWLMTKEDWTRAEEALFKAAQDCDGDDGPDYDY